ncbi:MAG: LysR family transcriptional regulator [Xanthobacteraceae bacterium]
MLNLSHVRSYLAVVDGRGFRAAARRLKLSPSTIVDHIRLLEADFAAPLLLRRRGGTVPTPQGEAFLPLARALLATAERAREVVAGFPLRIAAASNVGTYLLHPTLASFRETSSYPTELWIGGNPNVSERLDSRRADVGLMEWWDDRPGFRACIWRREPLVVIVGPRHPWANRRQIDAADLIGVRMLGGERGTGTGTLLRQALGAVADRIETIDGFGSTEAVKRAVRAGLGISLVLAAAVADEVAAGELVALPFAGADLVKDIRLIVPDPLPAGSAAAQFAAHALGGLVDAPL